MSKKSAQPGDLIEVCSLKYNSGTIIVESLSREEIYEEVPNGTIAIFISKSGKGSNVMLPSSLVGWVFDDEWRPLDSH